ncbi:MAG: RQC-minor-1 family DNA-binding protein [Massilia sp.]
MTKRINRISYSLDSKSITALPDEDIRAILRAADPLIGVGGRTLLSKILKGSRAQDVVGRELDRIPAYGFYRALPPEEILARIDWMILSGYLRIVYEGKLPVLIYTPTGWYIERDTFASELLSGFDELLAGGARPYPMAYLVDRDRDMILLLLDKVAASGDAKYLPVLEDWERVDHKKVRMAIRDVMARLRLPQLGGGLVTGNSVSAARGK